MKLNFIAPLLLLFVVQGCAPYKEPTVAEKAAKLLIVGIEGQRLTEENPIIPSIADKGVAGVILFGSNVSSREQVTTLISDLKALRREPLIVSIDQEGGFVNRLKTSSGFEPMASHRTAGSATDDEQLREIASTIASEVASIGVNLNFAPCVDVDINPSCPVIGHFARSFSPDEQRVAHCASIYVEEHRKADVRTALKHFPGHGSSLADSHFGLTDITATWQQRELAPYSTLIDLGLCDAVMVSHLYNSNIDADYPATLSRATINGILREQLGWQGVVVTDDMQMRAITDHYGFEHAVTLALNAGVDLFIVGGNIRREQYDVVDKFISIIEQGIASGKISMESLDAAYHRVMEFSSGL
ncbi:MAG: glycoside hydrolase family 3 N-terminal domain-containing protein [Rikenellaceae bacterium]